MFFLVVQHARVALRDHFYLLPIYVRGSAPPWLAVLGCGCLPTSGGVPDECMVVQFRLFGAMLEQLCERGRLSVLCGALRVA